MAEKEKGRRRANGLALPHITKSLDSFDLKDTVGDGFRQEPVDLVELLSARSGVAVATVRAHLAAFGMEARS